MELRSVDRIQADLNGRIPGGINVSWNLEGDHLTIIINAAATAVVSNDYVLGLFSRNSLLGAGRRLQIPFAVTAKTMMSDLNVSCTAVPQRIRPGQSSGLSVTLQNAGPDRAVFPPNSYMFTYATRGIQNYTRPQETVIEPGQLFQVSIPLDLSSIPAGRDSTTFPITVVYDPGHGPVNDTNSANNTANCALIIDRSPSYPDLTITSLTINPTPLRSDSDFTAHITVKNIGNDTASINPPFPVIAARLETRRDLPVGSTQPDETEGRDYQILAPAGGFRLAPEGETSFDIVMHAYPKYKYQDWNHEMRQKLTVQVDPQNRLPGGDNLDPFRLTRNNTTTLDPLPWENDVRRWEISDCMINPSSPVEGGTVRISLDVRNTGNVRIPVPQGSMYILVLGTNFSFSSMGGSDVFLDPGQSRHFEFAYPSSPDTLRAGSVSLTMSTYDGVRKACTFTVGRRPVIMY